MDHKIIEKWEKTADRLMKLSKEETLEKLAKLREENKNCMYRAYFLDTGSNDKN